jgi:hypothetical protein
VLGIIELSFAVYVDRACELQRAFPAVEKGVDKYEISRPIYEQEVDKGC